MIAVAVAIAMTVSVVSIQDLRHRAISTARMTASCSSSVIFTHVSMGGKDGALGMRVSASESLDDTRAGMAGLVLPIGSDKDVLAMLRFGGVPMSGVLRWAVAVSIGLGATIVPATAFDDADFCTAARQLAVAADRDVGVWIDRKTRNAGIEVICERKRVEFRRFTYSPASVMDGAWKASKGAEWSGMQCASPLWRQAIRNNWKVALSVTAADGESVVLDAECK